MESTAGEPVSCNLTALGESEPAPVRGIFRVMIWGFAVCALGHGAVSQEPDSALLWLGLSLTVPGPQFISV